jgi:polar amino acid transport system substrate-binding protein
MLEALGLSSGENLLWFAMKYDELKPFTAGRVDLIVGSALTIEAQVKHAELTLSDIAPVFVIELPPHLGNYLALNIDTDDELVDKLKASLDMLRSQNMIKSIEKQFVKPFPMKQASAKDQNLWNTCVKSFD